MLLGSLFLNFQSLGSRLKNGIKKIKQASRNKILPAIAQKFPMLDIKNPSADNMKKIQPIRFIVLFFIFGPLIF